MERSESYNRYHTPTFHRQKGNVWQQARLSELGKNTRPLISLARTEMRLAGESSRNDCGGGVSVSIDRQAQHPMHASEDFDRKLRATGDATRIPSITEQTSGERKPYTYSEALGNPGKQFGCQKWETVRGSNKQKWDSTWSEKD